MNTVMKYLKDEGLFGWNYKHLLTHPWILVGEMYRHTKWFIQRGHRGYADCDAWSLDGYLASWMPAAIRSMKNAGHGFPVIAYTDLFGDTQLDGEWPLEKCEAARKHWHSVLEQIAVGFEAARKIQEYDIKDNMDLQMSIMDNGLNLFRKYFLNLWD